MSRREKQLYVGGFLDGSANQAHVLCQNIESGPDNRIRPVKPSDGLVDPCLSFRSSYSHVNLGLPPDLKSVDPYVSIIDDFYSHSECRPMPYPAILEHLDDSEFLNGEELYHLVRSGNAAWRSFTGFDGIDDCYGADRKR